MMRLAFCLLMVAAVPAHAADTWTRLSTPHFEVLTNAGEKRGREVLQQFEQVRGFIQQVIRAEAAPAAPVRILAFKRPDDYKPYSPNEVAAAYYVGGDGRELIVLRSPSADSFPVAIHEYMHLMVRRAKLDLPLWLNEGLAELFSTLRPYSGKILVGELPVGRVMELANGKWYALNSLISVGHDSPLYNEKNKAGMFYAQSWALTHMLNLSPEYNPQFDKFFALAMRGTPTGEALQQAYGKSLEQVQKDLQSYLRGGERLRGSLFDAKLDRRAVESAVTTPTETEMELALAETLAMIRKPDEARQRYQRAAAQKPDKWEVQRDLGYLAWRLRDSAAARTHFAQAMDGGATDAAMLALYGRLADDAARRTAALTKSLDLQPEQNETRLLLGWTLLEQRRHPEALRELAKIKRVTPVEAPEFFRALALAFFENGNRAEADKSLARARQHAKTPVQIDHLAKLETYFTQAAAYRQRGANPSTGATPEAAAPILRRAAAPVPTTESSELPREEPRRRVQGELQQVECLGEQARLHLMVDGRKQVFSIVDPTAVEMRNAGEVKFTFTCGPQKPARTVALEVSEEAPAPAGTEGVVRVFDLKP